MHRPFRGLLGVHSHYGLHTRAVTVYRDTLIEGFSHFVTSMTAPIASGWSVCRMGLAPTGKRRLYTAHRNSRHPSTAASGNEPTFAVAKFLSSATYRKRCFFETTIPHLPHRKTSDQWLVNAGRNAVA
jgi:hypothetical protein